MYEVCYRTILRRQRRLRNEECKLLFCVEHSWLTVYFFVTFCYYGSFFTLVWSILGFRIIVFFWLHSVTMEAFVSVALERNTHYSAGKSNYTATQGSENFIR